MELIITIAVMMTQNIIMLLVVVCLNQQVVIHMMLLIVNVLNVNKILNNTLKLMGILQWYVVITKLILDNGIKIYQTRLHVRIKEILHKIMFPSYIQEIAIVF